MEKTILLCNLYDCYGELLTDKQKNYFKDYYFDNLSLSEMSKNYGVSRNAIYNLLKDVETKLRNYEEKLELYDKKNKINLLIENIDENIKKQISELL